MMGILNLAYLALAAIGADGRFLTSLSDNVVRSHLSSHGASEGHLHLLGRDDPPHPNALCRLSMYKELQKRGILVDMATLENGTLIERDMTLPEAGEDLDKYVVRETENEDANGQIVDPSMQRLHWSNTATGYDVNTAEFRPFENDAFGYNLAGLVGCTGMVILSRRGVYIAHYWENIGFNQDKKPDEDKDKNNPSTKYKSQQNAFDYTIKRGLQRGISRKNQPKEQDSLVACANAIDDDSIHAFLMIPRTGPSDGDDGVDDPYRDYWNQMKTIIHGILPRLDPADPTRWSEYRYNPRQAEEIQRDENGESIDPLDTTARGRILFKFDPNHHGKKKTLLIFETSPQEAGNWEWT